MKVVMTMFESVLPNVATTSTAFGELSPDQQAEIWSWARVRQLLSGETLVLQNAAADAIFVVVSGRFEVRVERQPVPLAGTVARRHPDQFGDAYREAIRSNIPTVIEVVITATPAYRSPAPQRFRGI
jgi:5-deoxy-D-glucuronate isomerase